METLGIRMNSMKTLEFIDKQELESVLAEKIIQDLSDEISKNGRARMLVSGGSTPVGLFHKLSNGDMDWSKVEIGLVDERFVPVTDSASNEKLVRENLLTNNAKNAQFTGMVFYSNDIFKNLEKVEEEYYKFKNNTTVSILGMGTDGHTASLFPGNHSSEEDLKGENSSIVINTLSPAEPRRRISCSKNTILNSQNLYLMIVGEEKMAVFNQAHLMKLPISYFFGNLQTYYSRKK